MFKTTFKIMNIEFHKITAFRLSFWFNFIFSVIIELFASYMVWVFIFKEQNLTEYKGYTLSDLMQFFVTAQCAFLVIFGGDLSDLSDEIYDGSISKYLIYPLNMLGYLLSRHLGQACVAIFQSFLLLSIFSFFMAEKIVFFDNPTLIFLSLPVLILGSILYFFMKFCLDCMAFWVDQVWSLSVMLRLCTKFLGGALIPIEMFPHAIQTVVKFLPFPLMLQFPAKILLGKITPSEYFHSIFLLCAWTLGLCLVSHFVLTQGLKKYSGVGQ